MIAREGRRGYQFVSSIKYNDFVKNDEKQYAVIKTIEIIGEAAKRLPISLRQHIPDIPWKDMAGMRDVLVHKFDRVDLGIVWDVARNHLPDIIDKIMRYTPMIDIIVDLPSSWSVKRLSDVADIYMGQSPPSSSYNERGEGIAFLQGKAEFGEVFPRNIKWTTQPKRISTPWSILISVRAPVGNVNLSDRRYAIGRGLAEVRPKHYTDAWYLFFVLLYERPRLRSEASGTIFQSINKKTLQEFLILYPPFPEQRAIAHVLRTVQEAREATERVIVALRDLKRSLMRHLFTYGPVPVDEVDQVALQDTPIGPIPAHWRVARLGEVATTTSGGTPNRNDPNNFGGSIPWLKSGELQDSPISASEEYLTEYGLRHSNAKIFPKGSLLIAMYGATAGKVGILEIEAATNQAICAILPKKPNTLSWYLFYALIYRREDLKAQRYGGAQPNLSQRAIRSFEVPLPPLPEQREIARILQTVDRKIEAEEARKEALDALFRSLLHHLMTAKIRLPREFVERFVE